MPDVVAQVVRGHVQDASLAWRNKSYVADEVFPSIKLPTDKAKMTKYNRGDAFRDTAGQRAPGDKTPVSDWKLSTVDVDCKQYANKAQLTKEDLQEEGITNFLTPPVSQQQEKVEWNADKLDLRKELLVASAVTSPSSAWEDGNASGEDADAKWVATSGNTFLTDVDKAINALQKAGIDRTNIRLLMDDITFQGVIRVDEVTGPLSYTSNMARNAPGLVITEEMLANLLTIEKVIVARSIYNTANEAAAGTDFTYASIWGGTKGKAFVYYYPPAPTRKSMMAGSSNWRPFNTPSGPKRYTKRWWDNDRDCWFFETQEYLGATQLTTNAGYLFTDTHTT